MATRSLILLVCGVVLTLGLKNVDYVQDNYMSTPEDQGSCGGCYGFALTSSLEWYVGELTGKSIALSNQYWIECQKDSAGNVINGCAGGVISQGIRNLMATNYNPYAEDYPYTADFSKTKCASEGFDGKRRNALADVWVYNYQKIPPTADGMRQALQSGPVISSMYIGDDFKGIYNSKINTDYSCASNPSPHALCFVGWQSNNGNPYYIVRNSYGPNWGVGGYAKYADNAANENCDYYDQAVTLNVGPRHELEYKLGAGKKKFDDARVWCKGLGAGWDLATIPTLMHNFQVYDMFTEKFGSDKKADTSFNYIWIGMFKGEWVDKKTPNVFLNFESRKAQEAFFYASMNKVNTGSAAMRGKWVTQKKTSMFRFVCSRWRNEACPRISQTAVENAESLEFTNDGAVSLEIDVGTMTEVKCLTGFTLTGPAAKCLSSGEWSDLPRCV